MNIKTFTIVLASIIGISFSANAKVWRINNTPGITADFTSGAAALASTSVVNDDTLHFEGSATYYTGFTLSKRLVIIGPGYFLSGADSNPGLQANTNSAHFAATFIFFDSTGSGSTLIGLDDFTFSTGTNLGSATDNITLTRCSNFTIGQYSGYVANTKMTGWIINKCHFYTFSLPDCLMENCQVTNNIILGNLYLNKIGNNNLLVRNNVLRGAVALYNAYFSNNIINSSISGLVNSSIKNNISSGNSLPAGDGNLNNQPDAVVFQGLTGNSTDGQWRLKAGSPAIGGGETIAGITPDCGAYGTADPYVLSGIPPVPTIYALTVPATVPGSATTMSITVSTKSNN